MALVSKTFIVDVVPGKTPPTVHVSERDVGRAYYVTLSDDGTQFRIPTGTTAKVEGTIGPYGFSESANVVSDTVIFVLSSKMTAVKGKVWAKIKLTHDTDTISTCAFWLNVDKAGSIEGEYIDPPVGPDSGGDEGGGITLDGLVQYNVAQNLTDAEKAQARTNIGAVAAASGKGLSTNDYTAAEKDKLSGIEEGAEKNVQSDWNQEDSSAKDFIKNKPTIPAEQIQADWNQTDANAKDFIKNKPGLKDDSCYSKVLTLSLSSNNIGVYTTQDSSTKLYRDDIAALLSNHEIPVLINPATGEVYYFYKQPNIVEALSNTGELVFICVTDDSIKKLVLVVNANAYEHSVTPIDKHYTFYYSVTDDDWDLDYDEITSLLASGYDIQCKIICGNSEFYAKLRRNRKNSPEGSDIYVFDAQTYQDEDGTMWWMSIRVTENNAVDYLEGSYVPDPAIYHRITLNADGTVKTKPSSLTYAHVYPRLTDNQVSDYLLITWGATQFLAKAVEHISGSVSDIKFVADCEHDGMQRHMVFTLATSDTLTTTLIETYSRRPVVVWEVQDATQGLSALNTNISSSLAWQLTNLDLTPFKRIKIYSRAGRKTGAIAADSSITPASIIEMSLDDRAKETVSQNVFIGSAVVQNPNDANRLGLLTCAVSADKTKFAVVRATTLYGTAATSNTDAHPNVFMIEGYYD